MEDATHKSPAQAPTTAPGPRSFATFLESAPQDAPEIVTDLMEPQRGGDYLLSTPDIDLHCASQRCDGVRRFHSDTRGYLTNEMGCEFLRYVCRNCRTTLKVFALLAERSENRVTKLGEFPAFGPPTPARLIALVGSDRELFLKGRRAELRGLGIGAFAYYRRVVEDKKGAIIGEIAKVAKRLGAPPETLALFAAAQAETQFSKAIDMIKGAIPQSLLINDKNPLTLLHPVLSEGLHAKSDEECLELATSVRLVLIELADRMATALKDEAELTSAVNKLLKS